MPHGNLSELVKEKRLRRKLERKYNKTKLAVDKERLDHQRNICNHLLTQAKQDYFKTKIETAETSKDLYKVCDNLLESRNLFYHPMTALKTLLINLLLILMIK